MVTWPLERTINEDRVCVICREKLPEASNQKGMPDFLQQLQDLIEEDK